MLEGDEVLEWEKDHAEAVAEVLDVELVITGPHDPESITGKRVGIDCMARDRQRVQREGDITAVGEMSYPATLGLLFCLNNQPWETAIHRGETRRYKPSNVGGSLRRC